MASGMHFGSGSTLSVTFDRVLSQELSEDSPVDLPVASSLAVQYINDLPSYFFSNVFPALI